MAKFCLEIGVPLKSLRTVVTKAEELKFDGIFYGDSLGSYQLECWSTLAIISSYTKSIRLGPAVTFPLIRHPSILARTAATIDQFSNGRLEFRVGLGGKTMKSDSEKYGFDFRTYDERIKILDESLQIIESLWKNDETNFDGEYFNLNSARREVAPIQNNGPPITIAGKSPGILELLGKYGDVWEAGGKKDSNYPSLIEKVNSICSKYNKPKIEKSIELFVLFENEESNVHNDVFDGWNFVNGNAEGISKEIQKFIDIGFNRFAVYFVNNDGNPFRQNEKSMLEQMELFKDLVIPNLED